MTQRQRRAIHRALCDLQETTDDAFRLRLLANVSLLPELRLVARFPGIAEQRDELEGIIAYWEMQLGAHAADRGRDKSGFARFIDDAPRRGLSISI